MPQDAFTLKFIADELSKELVGAKINRINQPNPDEVVLFTYNKGSNKSCLFRPTRCRLVYLLSKRKSLTR